MLFRFPLLFFFSFCSLSSNAQLVLWASELLEVSSEHTDQFYSPKNRGIQILGTPSIYPQMTASPCSWQPNGSDFGEDYIKVKFDQAIVIRQIAIVENWNPGAIARIFGYDEQGNEYLLYQNTGAKPKVRNRFWRVQIEEPSPQKLNAVKFLVNHRMSRGIKEYDAIAISDSEELIQFEINLAEDIPEDLKKANLGNVVNSVYGEVAPIITPDGQRLYFTRLDHPENIRAKKNKDGPVGQDIWFSQLKENGLWGVPNNLGKPINNELDNAAATASADGNSLYILNVYHPSGRLLAGLSRTKYENKAWKMPEKVTIQNFQAIGERNPITNETEIKTEYSISHDENILIMGLQRNRTYGGKDLYVSFKLADGSYSLPKNMGNVLNTAANEGSPFISADSKTLYFNSKGHPGFGEADIYVSRRLDDSWTNWSEPLNLGPQINSVLWDGYFSIPASGDFAYLSSKDNSIGQEDIFKMELFESIKPEPMVILSGRIFEVNSRVPINLPILITSNQPNSTEREINVEINPNTKEYKVILPAGYTYQIEISGLGYLAIKDSLDLSQSRQYAEVKKDFSMIPIKAGHTMVLQNLLFEQGKFEIKKSSYDELSVIISIMKEYPDMEVLLEGHTDNQGDFTLNVELAKNRVEEVKKYLVEQGAILANRIATKSWGPIKPISSNSTPETRKKNRRVEFTILKM